MPNLELSFCFSQDDSENEKDPQRTHCFVAQGVPLTVTVCTTNDMPWEDFLTPHLQILHAITDDILRRTGHLRIRQEYFVTLFLTDNDDIHDLNKTYRDTDKSTNVLSFSQYPQAELWQKTYPDIMPIELGDIFIAWDYVKTEADCLNIPMYEHFFHLFIHGMLHILGYDHIDLQEAKQMEALETDILHHFGFEKPYEQDIFQ